LLIILVTALGMIGYALLRLEPLPLALDWPAADMVEWTYDHFYLLMTACLILVGAGGAVHSQSRIAAVASLGIVGYGVALIYVFYGAPDLAITQFLVETLTVLLFMFVFYHLPGSQRVSSPSRRMRDLIVAGTTGVMMGVLVLVAVNVQLHDKISDFFTEQSVDVGRGRNIVNVILVDFRALDTLGEIVVLSVAAIGVLALLKLRPRGEDGA
jgi:multicomponent Na+:H+ antiporter subunit A